MKKLSLLLLIITIVILSVVPSFAEEVEYPLLSNDDVQYAKGGTETVFEFDFSDRNINPYNISEFKFRMYCPYSITDVSLQYEDKVVFNYELTDDDGRWWVEVSFKKGCDYQCEDMTLGDLADENGKLSKLKLVFHKVKDKEETVFIDSVELIEREKDTIGPAINYSGVNVFSVTAEKPFTLKDVSAYDEYEDREVDLEYVFPDGVKLDDYGCPEVGGPYDCKLIAKDLSGNQTELLFTLTVREKDTEPPVIHLDLDEITIKAGTFFDPTALVSDNEDDVECRYKWATKGSVDGYGRVVEGDHELTLTCVDLTGNVTEKKITVHVVSEDKIKDYSITRDESILTFPDEIIPYAVVIGGFLLIIAVVIVLVIALRKAAKAKKVEF